MDTETPEYKAISRNRQRLEQYQTSFLKEIAGRLRDLDYLTIPQHDSILSPTANSGSAELIGNILESIRIDPVETFVDFVSVLKQFGNRPFKKFVSETIEAERKKCYRDLLKYSGASGRSYDVFISYGHETETNTAVENVSKRLQQEGLEVFVDKTGIMPGNIWPAEIVSAINTCQAFIAVLTKKYVRSHYCNGELFEAEALRKPLFPIKFEAGWDEGAAGVPIQAVVNKIQYAELKPGEEISDQFVGSIMEKCGKSQSTPGSLTTNYSSGATGSSSTDGKSQASQAAGTTGGGSNQGGESIAQNVGVTNNQLDQEIQNRDHFHLANFLGSPNDYVDELKLNAAEKATVGNQAAQNVQTGMMKALALWKQHNPFGTFRDLYDILLRLNKQQEARELCDYVIYYNVP